MSILSEVHLHSVCFCFISGREGIEKGGRGSREKEGRQAQSSVRKEGLRKWLIQQDPRPSER